MSKNHTGTHYGITYEAEKKDPDWGSPYYKVYLYQGGELIPDRYIGLYDVLKERAYHTVDDLSDISRLCKRVFWARAIGSRERPLKEVQDTIYIRTERKVARLLNRRRHERWKEAETERAARMAGKAREQVKPHDVDALREADTGYDTLN